MYHITVVQNYGETWAKYNLEMKANLLLAKLKHAKITSLGRRTTRYGTLEEVTPSIQVNHALHDLTTLLSEMQFKHKLTESESSQVVTTIAQSLADPEVIKWCKYNYLFPAGVVVWATTQNNITVLQGIKDFSNQCCRQYAKPAQPANRF